MISFSCSSTPEKQDGCQLYFQLSTRRSVWRLPWGLILSWLWGMELLHLIIRRLKMVQDLVVISATISWLHVIQPKIEHWINNVQSQDRPFAQWLHLWELSWQPRCLTIQRASLPVLPRCILIAIEPSSAFFPNKYVVTLALSALTACTVPRLINVQAVQQWWRKATNPTGKVSCSKSATILTTLKTWLDLPKWTLRWPISTSNPMAVTSNDNLNWEERHLDAQHYEKDTSEVTQSDRHQFLPMPILQKLHHLFINYT